ncbi:MAG TPA: tetratricopeptide repeat protein [bacterium]
MLRPRKKLAKKEIKEDALVTTIFKVQRLYSTYRKQIEIGLIAVLAVVVLGGLMLRSKKSAERQASARLGLTEPAYFSGEYQRVIPELTSIQEKYPGTPSAGEAVFYLGNAQFAVGNLDQAEACFRRYAEDYGQNRAFKASSLAGMAAVQEARKQYEKAAVLYEKAGRNYQDLFSAPSYLMNAGRCYAAANDIAKGKQLYQILLDKYPDSNAAQEARALIESL